MNIQDAISCSIILLYGITLFLFFYTKNPIHLKAFMGLLGTNALSETIKYVFVKEVSPRPIGATDCNILCNNGNQEGKSGMPSSHSATVAFFSAFYYQQTNNTIIRCALIGYDILMMISRYVKRCHSIPQIIVGTLLGISISRIIA